MNIHPQILDGMDRMALPAFLDLERASTIIVRIGSASLAAKVQARDQPNEDCSFCRKAAHVTVLIDRNE